MYSQFNVYMVVSKLCDVYRCHTVKCKILPLYWPLIIHVDKLAICFPKIDLINIISINEKKSFFFWLPKKLKVTTFWILANYIQTQLCWILLLVCDIQSNTYHMKSWKTIDITFFEIDQNHCNKSKKEYRRKKIFFRRFDKKIAQLPQLGIAR